MVVVDSHTHWLTKAYVELLEALKTAPRIERQPPGLFMVQRGFSLPITPNFYDLKLRLKEMAQAGVDFQVLSLLNPWVDFLDPELSAKIAKQSNDEISDVCREHPDKFAGLATLPYKNVAAAIEELERAVLNLGMKGIAIGSNIDGDPVHAERFWPVFKRAAELKAPLFIHPTAPVIGQDKLTDNFLLPTIGFPIETAVAVLRMIYSGLFDRIPRLKVVCAHLGGFLPFMAGRLDAAYLSFPGLKGVSLHPPTYYLKRMYFDAVTYSGGMTDHALAIECSRALVGSDRLLFGSDYPFAIGDASAGVELIENSRMSKQEKRNILGKNVIDMLELPL